MMLFLILLSTMPKMGSAKRSYSDQSIRGYVTEVNKMFFGCFGAHHSDYFKINTVFNLL